MKKILYIIAVVLGLGINANAQDVETISLRVPEFARPLVENWTKKYNQIHYFESMY